MTETKPQMGTDAKSRRLYNTVLILYVGLFAVYALLPNSRQSTAIFLICTIIHTAIGWILIARNDAAPFASHHTTWLLFYVPRLLVLPMMPWLSDDVLRYLWDGTLVAGGVNSYGYAPMDPELIPFRNELYNSLDYKDIPTIYPPLAQGGFAIAVIIGSWLSDTWMASYLAWKCILIAAEALGVWLILKTASRINLAQKALGLYLFLPLPAIELAGQGHLDGLSVPIMGALIFLAACYFYGKRQTVRTRTEAHRFPAWQTGALLAALGGIKILPVALALPLLRLRIGLRAKAIMLGVCIAGGLVLAVPFIIHPDALGNFFTSVEYFSNTLQFNGVVLYTTLLALEISAVDQWWILGPKVVSAVRVLATLAVGLARRPQTFDALMRLMFAVLLTITLISPKVHTWYFVPLLLLNAVIGYRWFMLFAQANMLTYAIYIAEPYEERYILECVIWAAGILFAFFEWRRDQRRRTLSVKDNSPT